MIDPPRDPDAAPESEPGPGADREPESTPELSDGRARRRLRAAVALTLVVAIVVFGAVGGARLIRPADVETPATAQPSRLAAIDARGALATMDGSGGSVVAYPVPGVSFAFPAWSPDGSHLAAIGQASDHVGVYVFVVAPATTAVASTAPAAEPAVIYRSPDRAPFYLYWTPDSRRVSFLANEPGGIALRIAPAAGGSEAATVREGAPLYWDWVDAGRLIAHVGGGADAFLGELGVDDPAGAGALLKPGGPKSAGEFRSPAVSRDGRYRAYVETAGDTAQELVVEARDGSTSHTVAVSGSTAFGFDPAGDASVAFVAPAEGSSEPASLPIGPLRLVDAASGSSRTLLGGQVVAFFWAPDGRTIATLGVTKPGGGVEAARTTIVPALARLRRPGASSNALEAAVTTETAAGLGLHLAFIDVATAAVRSQREVQVSDTFGTQVLPFFDQYALSHRFWSADSASLALPLVDAAGADQLVVLPADGSASHSIPDRVLGFWSP